VGTAGDEVALNPPVAAGFVGMGTTVGEHAATRNANDAIARLASGRTVAG
jgi:hypothetical protein